MTKDKLTAENVKKDLLKVASAVQSRKSDKRDRYIIVPIILATGFGVGLKNVWVTLPFIAFAAFHIIKLILELREGLDVKKKIRAAVDRGDFSVSVERLSHVVNETICEPSYYRGRSRSIKEITVLYFLSGTCWRVPYVNLHYEWSKEMKMSGAGLLHTSVKDNDFYVISLKGYPDISYVYNTKMFELCEGLGEEI